MPDVRRFATPQDTATAEQAQEWLRSIFESMQRNTTRLGEAMLPTPKEDERVKQFGGIRAPRMEELSPAEMLSYVAPTPLMTSGQYMDRLSRLYETPDISSGTKLSLLQAARAYEKVGTPTEDALSRLRNVILELPHGDDRWAGMIEPVKSSTSDLVKWANMYEKYYRPHKITPAGEGADLEYIISLNPKARDLSGTTMQHEARHLQRNASPVEGEFEQLAKKFLREEPGVNEPTAFLTGTSEPLSRFGDGGLGSSLRNNPSYYGRPDEYMAEAGAIHDILKAVYPAESEEFVEFLRRRAEDKFQPVGKIPPTQGTIQSLVERLRGGW